MRKNQIFHPYKSIKEFLEKDFYDGHIFLEELEKIESNSIGIIASQSVRVFQAQKFIAYIMFEDDCLVLRGKPNGKLKKGTVDFSIPFFEFYISRLPIDIYVYEGVRLENTKWQSVSVYHNSKHASRYFEVFIDCLKSFPITSGIKSKVYSAADTDSLELQHLYLTEGKELQLKLTSYERNPKARKMCLDHWGYNCKICDFNFQKVYGSLGEKFIHVHHVIPISSVGHEHIVNPIRDLVPVCPNCHSMLHRSNKTLEIEELKQRMKIQCK